LGMTICYDVRFPHLYRDLAKAGAQIIAVPAAFTAPTGKAHWHALLRARAIETGAYIIAPAQGGRHEDGRTTFGHSLVVDPWGEIFAELDHDDPGVLICALKLDKVAEARSKIPALTHDRPYSAP
jgi:predicted amidohydrolase